jgi:hypothetical protein
VLDCQLKKRRPETSPYGAPSNIHRRSILIVIDSMCRKAKHRGFSVEFADRDEEGLAALHGLSVNIRRKARAPRIHDLWRIEVRTDRSDRIDVSPGNRLSVVRIRPAHPNLTDSHRK